MRSLIREVQRVIREHQMGVVIVRFALPTPLRFRFTHRAFAAADSFALVAADILFPLALTAERDTAVPRSEARRFFKASIWRRIESASSNDLRDMSMSCG